MLRNSCDNADADEVEADTINGMINAAADYEEEEDIRAEYCNTER